MIEIKRCKESLLEKRPVDNWQSCVESIQGCSDDKGQDINQSSALSALEVRGARLPEGLHHYTQIM